MKSSPRSGITSDSQAGECGSGPRWLAPVLASMSLALGVALLGEPPDGTTGPLNPKMNAKGIVTLAYPALPRGDEKAIIRLKVGPLARGSHLLGTTLDGKEVVSIRAFSLREPSRELAYTFVVPADVLKELKLTLKFTIKDPDQEKVRVPTDKEIVEITTLVGK